MAHTTKLIDGNQIAKEVREELREKIERLKQEHGVTPCLSVILVGDRGDSATYVRMKQRNAELLGMAFRLVSRPTDVTQDELLQLVDELNEDPLVHGLIVQLPLPAHIDEAAVVTRVAYNKDVDGFHATNMGNLALKGREALFEPCTARGVLELLRRSNVTIRGRNAVVVGRSNIVGIPTALLLLHENATVTICHSQTDDLPAKIATADILVAAVGRARFIEASWLKPGVVVIDVGTNSVPDATKKTGYSLVGDVDFQSAVEQNIPSLITPVPGGVGPMTVAILLQNTVKSAYRFAGQKL